jgi:RNA recognition motif-containing protein
LPRHETTRDIKGFAFVEFEKEAEAESALKVVRLFILQMLLLIL